MIEYRNLKGKLHRTDGPAIEYADGTKKWYIDDKLHREDGPAVERADCTKNGTSMANVIEKMVQL